jgi:hypothetical protein
MPQQPGAPAATLLHQGHQAAEALVRPGVLRRRGWAGALADLETLTQRNGRLNLWHGYADLGTLICLPDGPQMFPMARQPRPASAAR